MDFFSSVRSHIYILVSCLKKSCLVPFLFSSLFKVLLYARAFATISSGKGKRNDVVTLFLFTSSEMDATGVFYRDGLDEFRDIFVMAINCQCVGALQYGVRGVLVSGEEKGNDPREIPAIPFSHCRDVKCSVVK